MNKYAELLEDLFEQLRDALVSGGIGPKVAEEVAKSATERICIHWGGQQLYIPMNTFFRLGERDLEIFSKFNGSNYDVLAREYGLNVLRVRTIINAVRKQQFKNRQMDLFPPTATSS